MRMGNDLADALRAELHDRLIRAYGDLKVAASEIGIPYKTLYRAFTTKGKDRTATVSLDFILEVIAHLDARFGDASFNDVHAAAQARVTRGTRAPGELVQGRFPQHDVPASVEDERRVAQKKSRDPGEDQGAF